MTIRGITPGDLFQDARVGAIAFVERFDEEKEREKERGGDREDFWVKCGIGAFDEAGKLRARMASIPYTVYFDGQQCGMHGIGGVASLPESRQKGNIRAIFQCAFERMLEQGVLLSTLYPFSHMYYRKFGYEMCMSYAQYTIPMNQLASFPEPHEAVMLDDGATREEFDALHTRFIARYNLGVKRTDKEWGSVLGGGLKSLRYAYLLKDEHGEAIASVVLRAEGEGEEKTVNAVDIAYMDHEALRRVFGFVHRLRAAFRRLTVILPAEEEMLSAMPEPWEVKARIDPNGMARVVDVQGVLERIRLPEGKGNFSVAVSDGMIERNNGVFRVEYDNGARNIAKVTGNADVSMDVRTFALLALGGGDMRSARMRPDFVVSGNEWTLDQVFTRKPIFMLDRF